MADDHTSATSAANAGRARTQGAGGQRKAAGATEQRNFDGDLGSGTPANVDIHKLGQGDRPQEYWGETGGAEATFSSNHSRRGETNLGQGGKTRRANKDIVSRRG
jgi:hypothetical protein